MSHRSTTLFLAGLAVVSLSACGDSRLKKLSVGIDKDSLAVLMASDAPHTSASYLTEGKYWELLMYPRKEAAAGDSIAWREMSPVVMTDGKVVGWGWSYLDETAVKQGFQVPAKE